MSLAGNCITLLTYILHYVSKGKGIPVTCRGGPYDCETSRLPHFLENWLTGGGEVVRLRYIFFLCFWYSFLLEVEFTPGSSAAEAPLVRPNGGP
jgi:hypothetical protein